VVAALNLAGQSVHEYQGFRFSLFPRQGGRALELDNLEHLQWMGRFIGRLHAVGACRSFENRLQLNVGTYGQNPYQFLTKHEFIPLEFRSQFDELMPKLLDLLKHNFELVDDLQIIRLHGDCHPGNILWAEDGPWFVDLDDCLMGPAIQDIWMLLTGANEQENRRAVDAILRGYQEFHDFNYDELYLIEALRTLRMIHYSGWLAKRWHDPAFPLNFPWFNSLSYWQEQLYSLQQQVELVEKSCQALKPWGL
jgi:Ser/Thr protein kinase RdoA (MazF antagonist)